MEKEYGREKIPYINTVWRILVFSAKCAPLEIIFCVSIHLLLGLLPVGITYVWNLFLENLNTCLSLSRSLNETGVFLILFAVSLGVANALPVMSETPDTMLRNNVKKAAYRKLHKKAERLPLACYDDPRINDFWINASDALYNGAFMYFIVSAASTISKGVTVVLMALLLWTFHPLLAVTVLITLLPVLLRNFLNKKILQLRYQQREKQREADTYTDFIVSRAYVKETRIWDTTGYFLKKRKAVMEDIMGQEKRVFQKIYLLELLLNAFDSIAYVVCISLGILLCVNGKVSVAQLGALFSAVNTSFATNKRLVDKVVEMRELLHEVYEGFKLFDLEEEKRGEQIPALEKEISAENVEFRYPGTDSPQIKNFSCHIQKNEVIAIVGTNGAGKSTIVKLLLGLYTPQKGSVRYDGQEIAHASYPSLFENTSAVFEDFNQYKATIKENVTLDETADEAEVKELLHEMGFQLSKYQDGLETALGAEFGGKDLSRGEWQKLSMARGYYKKSTLIVLDEPTAALDAKSEYNIYEDFRRICRGRTGIIVTHRLGAARLADRILYVENGTVLENGTHEELMRLGGKYARMFQAQRELYNS